MKKIVFLIANKNKMKIENMYIVMGLDSNTNKFLAYIEYD